jgi:SAM-dependent methyltransferase
MRRCRSCQHLFMESFPAPEVLGKLYARYGFARMSLAATPTFLRERGRALAHELERYATRRRILDVGFGAGVLLQAFTERNWQAYGIEASQAAVEQACAAGLKHVSHGDFLDASYADGFFDVVVMTELIEHLPDPRPYLQQAWRILRPGGLLYLTTPHGRGISARVLGLSWSVVAPPEHLNLFSRASLSLLLEQVGFMPVRWRIEGGNPLELLHRLRALSIGRSRSEAAPSCNRVASGMAMSSRLDSTRSGRLLRRALNGVLQLTQLGDSLRVAAIRST